MPRVAAEAEGSFDAYRRTLAPRLEAGLAAWIPEFYRDFPPAEREAIESVLHEGKHVRAALVCLVNEALGGSLDAAMPRAVAIECIQAASLIHDDYVDGDGLRRNRPATWTEKGARKAVLLGDLMFASAIRGVAELDHAAGAVVAQAIATIAGGAYREPLDADELARLVAEGRYQPETYETLIHLKTGALFGAAAKLGALAARADTRFADRAFTFGARLGEAYQIADDLVELGGDAAPGRIAPALLYFSAPGPVPEERDAGLQLQLGRRMRRAIASRMNEAAQAVAAFPANPYTRLLRHAPAEIVRLMLDPP